MSYYRDSFHPIDIFELDVNIINYFRMKMFNQLICSKCGLTERLHYLKVHYMNKILW